MPHAIGILILEHESLTKLLDLMDRLYEQILDGHAPDFRLFHPSAAICRDTRTRFTTRKKT